MKTQGLISLDRISTLPDNVIEHILTLMPIRYALRTSILSKRWRYSWRNMPKLAFTDYMLGRVCYSKSLFNNAIFHVLLLHSGPTKLVFYYCASGNPQMVSEFDKLIDYYSRRNGVKELKFTIFNRSYQLPVSFFSLHGLESIELENCVFVPPLTFNGFSRLKSVKFQNVDFSSQALQRFLPKSPLLEHVSLGRYSGCSHSVTGGITFTFVDLLRCVPLIQTLGIPQCFMEFLCAGGMPHKLPTSLANLKYVYLAVCLTEQNEIYSVLYVLRSSPVPQKFSVMSCVKGMPPVRQTPSNFFDPEDYSDLKLDNLETLEIEWFSNLPREIEFVKLIMAKSPMLKKVRIKFCYDRSTDE